MRLHGFYLHLPKSFGQENLARKTDITMICKQYQIRQRVSARSFPEALTKEKPEET